ncbi:MAG: DUF374 domain-containing protein [Proteobacteria bacterium]|nr:DUF374 domain-containing protein [Pseudomonadota bacterium]
MKKRKDRKRQKSLLQRSGERILLFLVPVIAYGLIRFLRLTMRIEIVNEEVTEPVIRNGLEDPVIIVFWHSRLLMMPLLVKKRRIAMLISRHRDGELISRAVRLFPVDSVRGSTTRGGSLALRGLVRAIKRGSHVAITPDGPRGPRNVVQPGVIMIASQTGRPIFPVTFSASRKKVFNSWDRFLFPYPFSRGVFIWGDPIWVRPQEGEIDIEKNRKNLETTLNRITAQADRYFNR